MDFPEKIEESRLVYLTERIRAKQLTPDEESELVIGHMRLLISKVMEWTRIAKYLYDDLMSSGMFAMLKAIRSAPEKLREDCSITQYILIHIKTAFKQTVESRSLIKVPRATQKSDYVRVKNGKTYIEKKGVKLKEHRLPYDGRTDDDSAKKISYHLEKYFKNFCVPPQKVDLQEIFDLCAVTPQEKLVLELKKQNYKMVEISKIMGINQSKVSAIMEEIEFRIRKSLREEMV